MSLHTMSVIGFAKRGECGTQSCDDDSRARLESLKRHCSQSREPARNAIASVHSEIGIICPEHIKSTSCPTIASFKKIV